MLQAAWPEDGGARFAAASDRKGGTADAVVAIRHLGTDIHFGHPAALVEETPGIGTSVFEF